MVSLKLISQRKSPISNFRAKAKKDEVLTTLVGQIIFFVIVYC